MKSLREEAAEKQERKRGREKERERKSREGGRRVIYIGRVTGGTFTPDKGQFSPHFCLI